MTQAVDLDATHPERRLVTERLGIIAAVAAYYLAGYFGVAWVNAGRAKYAGLALPFEHDIPFVPAFSLPYSLVFPAIILGFLSIPLREIQLFRRGAVVFTVNMTVCFVVFLLFPVTIQRPPAPLSGGWAESLTAFWFFLDPPTNLFPSLHVSMSVVSALVGWRHSRPIGVLTMAMAVLVAAATLFVHQHYFVDVLAGAAVAGATYWWLMARTERPRVPAEAAPV